METVKWIKMNCRIKISHQFVCARLYWTCNFWQVKRRSSLHASILIRCQATASSTTSAAAAAAVIRLSTSRPVHVTPTATCGRPAGPTVCRPGLASGPQVGRGHVGQTGGDQQ